MSTSEQIVDERLRPLIEAERALLAELRELAVEGEHAEDARRLGEILDGIDELFLLVIVGEFNSGKSSFINALFGQRTRVEGPIPVDDRVTIMRYGEEPSERAVSAFVVESRAPIDFLRDIAIVDTPGTNSVVRQHQEITEDFVPRADLVLFLTSIDRPLTESERQFLTYIRRWGKKIVVVLNKIDTKEPEEIDQVVDFVDAKFRELLGFRPTIFPVSARLALASKLGSSPRDWTRSRFEPLEDYVFHTLAEGERFRLKLLSPLDSARTVTDALGGEIEARRRLLGEDAAKIARIEEQLESARREMRANFEKFVLRVDALVVDLRDRGVDFLDRHVRLNHLKMLRSETLFRDAFEREVLAEWQTQLARAVDESVDWLVRGNVKLWNDTLEYFNAQVRKNEYDEKVLGRVGGQFVYEREEVHARIRREADERVRSLDHREECRRVIDSAISGLHQSVGLGASAVGLGYALATAFTSVALDVTGVAAAAVLFAASFFILPYKRHRAVEEFRAKTEKLRGDLRGAVETASRLEIDRAIDNVRAAFDPYTRYVRTEHGKVEERSRRLSSLGERLSVLRRDVETIVGPAPDERRRAS
jgi:small GTP-binding protein